MDRGRDAEIMNNIPLVKFLLKKKFQRYVDWLGWDDAFQWACLGLILAVDKYNGAAKLSTYVEYRIHDQLTMALWRQQLVRVPLKKWREGERLNVLAFRTTTVRRELKRVGVVLSKNE